MSAAGPRVMFFFDGFNVYHSLEAAARTTPDARLKWLDLTALATAHLYTLSALGRKFDDVFRHGRDAHKL